MVTHSMIGLYLLSGLFASVQAESESPNKDVSTYTVMASYFFYIAAAGCVGWTLASSPAPIDSRRRESRGTAVSDALEVATPGVEM